VTKPLLRNVKKSMQNMSKRFCLSEMVGKSLLMLFSLMPWGKKAITPRRSDVLGLRLRNVGEASESPIVVARLSS
jgi:hypothetical protein